MSKEVFPLVSFVSFVLLQLGPLGPFTHRARWQNFRDKFHSIFSASLFYVSQATKWSFGH